VSSTAIEGSGVSAGGASPGRLKTLLFLPSIAYYRTFESLVGALLAAGHQVLVALDHQRGGLPPDQAHTLDELREQHPGFDHRLLPARTGLWRIPASALRRSLDYLRYLEPEYADAEPLREQARDRAPRALRVLLFLPPFRWAFGRRAFAWLLRRLEAGIPLPGDVKAFISGHAPDVVLVSPLVELGSAQADYVRTADAARIPSVFVVASEDDLTSKGTIRAVPTLTVTWSETRVDDAVRLHGLPRERIVAMGAQSSNGFQAPAAASAVKAIEDAARTEVVARRAGRLLRPLLWLLTPLLAVVLVLFRPRATGRAAIRAVRRLLGRIRKRAKTLRRTMGRRRADRSKARAKAVKEEKLARAEAVKQEKLARAQAKGQAQAQAEGAKQQKLARAAGAKKGGEARPEPAKQPRGDAANGGDKAPADAPEKTEKTRG
jgi:hypothetical protein